MSTSSLKGVIKPTLYTSISSIQSTTYFKTDEVRFDFDEKNSVIFVCEDRIKVMDIIIQDAKKLLGKQL